MVRKRYTKFIPVDKGGEPIDPQEIIDRMETREPTDGKVRFVCFYMGLGRNHPTGEYAIEGCNVSISRNIKNHTIRISIDNNGNLESAVKVLENILGSNLLNISYISACRSRALQQA